MGAVLAVPICFVGEYTMKKIDFHSHILPRADHGSDSLETSLAQIKLALKHGVSTVIATPHFYPHKDTVERFLARRESAYGALRESIVAESLPITVMRGAEVLICRGIEALEGLEKLCVEGTRVLMLELPFSNFSSAFVDSAETLIKAGYNVVLAHADRYDYKDIERLIDVGAKIQLNASSLCTMFKKRHLYDWINRGLVVALGSDIHMADASAYRNYTKAIRKIGKKAEHIMEATAQLI